MANLFVNKKKVRGWKRRRREVDAWKNRHIHLDLDEVKLSQRKYVKIELDPWNRLITRTPPVWYSRIIFQALLDIHKSWDAQLQQYGEPYYLKAWLFHPHFSHSQVVCAIGDALHFYDNIFDKGTSDRKFPAMYSNIHDVELMEWELHIHSATHLESEWRESIALGDETIENYNKVVRYAYTSGAIGQDTYYAIQVGDVWLGSINPKL